MMREIISLLSMLIFTVALRAQAENPASPEPAASSAITAQSLAAHIEFLSDDLLEGRAPATRGSKLGMAYIASQYKRLGLVPDGDNGGWYQHFDVVGLTSEVPKKMHFQRSGKTLTLDTWTDFIAFSGVHQATAAVKDAEVVFVGYGIVAPEYGWDDYKDVDVRGKILLMMNNDPGGDDKAFFGGDARLYYGRWSYKYEMAQKKGAVGAIIIHTPYSAGYPFQVVQSSWTGEQFELPAAEGNGMPFKAWTSFPASMKLAEFAGHDLKTLMRAAEKKSFKPIPFGTSLSFAMQTKIRKLKTGNVLGLLRGSDPEKSKEVIVYTAHHDHLGIGRAVNADSVYNGARDNASGVASMLAIAEAYARLPQPPARSILFAAVGAEESGLLGSKHYAASPSFAPGYIAANINIDGMNIWGKTKDIVLIGYGKSEMDDHVEALATQLGRVVKPDQFPDKGYFYRSDQFSFAKIGVPASYFDEGIEFIGRDADWGRMQIDNWTRTDYHQPSDAFSPDWDLSGAVADSKFAFLLGLRVANADDMPGWRPGDEFEAARKAAIKAR